MNDSRKFYPEIFLVSFAALLLEISYTRLISFKLFYYYTYLIIGFALLGTGAGGVFVAVSKRLRSMELARLISVCSLAGALAAGIGYYFVATMEIDTKAIWAGGDPTANLLRILQLCAALFGTFICIGVVIASLFARRSDDIDRLYFADLLGAGIACVVVIPLLTVLTPPQAILAAAAVLAFTGAKVAYGEHTGLTAVNAITALGLAIVVMVPSLLPPLVTDTLKTISADTEVLFSKWNPVFRVDVTEVPGRDDHRTLHHDGLWGSSIYKWDGDLASLDKFDDSLRAVPFRVLGEKPAKVLIIGSAGGHEILASLYFGAENVRGVELNPATISLLSDAFLDYTGHLYEHPRVEIINDEGRSALSRSDSTFDLIWFVAPDSYTAMNAATSGAFVLSESYLYTQEMIVESLEHLSEDGIVSMQFGEMNYDGKPNRTTRYVATARAALEELGVEDPSRHILVGTAPNFITAATVLLKRTPFSDEEIDGFLSSVRNVEDGLPRHAWGHVLDDGPVNKAITLPSSELAAWHKSLPYAVHPITDDGPFFWHFSRFGTVLKEFTEPRIIDLEDSIGERVLVLLLGVSALFASIFLFIPFVAIRSIWRELPAKGISAGYFACLGLGFMFFEVCLIQKLTLLLGYPTYSLSITLMSLLIFTGVGSLLTRSFRDQRESASLVLLGLITGMTIFWQFGLGYVTEAALPTPLIVRAGIAVLFTAPLGLCLGAFMPLGLHAVSELTEHKDEYVAWGWAVNGFFSVIGSVLTTILSMMLGFRIVLALGLVAYCCAVFLLRRIPRTA